MNKRAKVLGIGLLLAVAVILARLFVIQIIEHDMWVARAEEEHIVQNKIKATRGEIYMMDGDKPSIAVMNETVWTIVVDPLVADEKRVPETLDAYAKDKLVAEWKDVFADKTRRYYVVARGVKRDAIEKIKKEELPGVWYSKGNARVYAEGQMASSLLGFVNADGKGQYGVEGALDKELAGEDGILKTVTDVNNVALSIGKDNVRVPEKDGKNVVLSIDKNVQYQLEKVLKNGIERSGTTHAAGIVMDPSNGEIWAMANLPTYDAKNYANIEDASVFVNVPLESAYEPGSMCKTFSFAAAIDQGKMTPETTYNNAGYLYVDGTTKIDNAYKGQIGTITMQTGLNFSLNTSSMTALMLLGNDPSRITQQGKDLLYDYYYNRFGLGQYTGIELFESPGYIMKPDEATYDSGYANMTFGQGLNLTMMQVASAFSAVVNGGEYYKPTIVAGEVTKDGEFKYQDEPEPVRRVISEETSATMRQMLYGVRAGNRSRGEDVPGYYIGGKTGTSQEIKDGKYTFDETIGGYVGFGGAEGELPEYVIMVKIWGEGLKMEGEKDAMPIFNEMSNYMIDYLKIKPGERQ